MSREESDEPKGKRARPAPGAEPGSSVDSVVGAVRTRLGARDSRGRPFAVYGVLFAGVATLLVLLVIVYFTATDRDRPDQPICTAIDPEAASIAIRDGQAERLTLAYDNDVLVATDNRFGPVLARLDYVNGQCANLPQGITSQSAIYTILGVIAFYNEATENTQVEIVYERSETLDGGLFVTPTPEPTATIVPSPTAPATEVTGSRPDPTPTERVAPATPTEATPAASPATAATPAT